MTSIWKTRDGTPESQLVWASFSLQNLYCITWTTCVNLWSVAAGRVRSWSWLMGWLS